ncbi:YceH family protein [Geomesophilobacter sediminis]|uniref:YceH family protein n=1 Tax=Geomesophilobacter sediminis TaxID=2798584 RepID=A0A8J7LYX1_9BACT|nr:YceH family protein [Geomesophilobacter sediminis]MBJ6725641.1 YceH family protein [Geomesophilobacter sediminis]
MKLNLTELEIRILGSLMEKELTTPENYPLSMNALQSACNQKSNRDPVLNLGEAEINQGLAGLAAKGLARRTTTGGRVDRYCHSLGDKLGLDPAARAILTELMLRGPQTPGELRNRCERMVQIADPEGVEGLLAKLMQFGPPLVIRLPRQPGRKEARYLQVFAGMPEITEEEPLEDAEKGPAQVRPKTPPRRERVLQLQEEVASLKGELGDLRQQVQGVIAAFK